MTPEARDALKQTIQEMRSAVTLSKQFSTPVADSQLILDWAEAIEAALAVSGAGLPRQQWQPIETAPLNESVLIGGGDCPFVHENMLREFRSAGRCWKGLGDKQQPAYWMAMPDPPVSGLPRPAEPPTCPACHQPAGYPYHPFGQCCRAAAPSADPDPPIDNGNLSSYCETVHLGCGCVRGAGHTGPHVFYQSPKPWYPHGPVVLWATDPPAEPAKPPQEPPCPKT